MQPKSSPASASREDKVLRAKDTSGCETQQAPSDDRKRKSSHISSSPPAFPEATRKSTSMVASCPADAEQPVCVQVKDAFAPAFHA